VPLPATYRSTKSRGAPTRLVVYGLAGWTVDSLFVSAHTGRLRPSSLLNVPVYALALPFFEPVHDRVRQRPLLARASLYAVGIMVVEYASARLLRRVRGQVPWDYRGARLAVDGLVRLDYAPLWAAYGLGLERLHDLLAGRRREEDVNRPGPPPHRGPARVAARGESG
jgi:uncharacterized membrane protein